MKATATLLGALLFLSFSSYGEHLFSSYAEHLSVLSEDYTPFQYTDAQGQPAGFGVELVREIFKMAEIEIKDQQIEILPWARSYERTLTKPATSVFMTVRNKQREALFKWVGPLATRTMWLYKLRSRSDIQFTTLEEAKRYSIAAYNQAADTDYLTSLGFEVQIISQQRQLTEMLVKGRMDLMSSNEPTMAARLRDLDLEPEVVEPMMILDDRFAYYLALNINTPDEQVKRLQLALDLFKANGDYQRLHDKYFK
jgi:polar amino acid transport system substrate-binding protein